MGFAKVTSKGDKEVAVISPRDLCRAPSRLRGSFRKAPQVEAARPDGSADELEPPEIPEF